MGFLSPARAVMSMIVGLFGYELVSSGSPDSSPPQQFDHMNAILAEAEAIAKRGDFNNTLTVLQRLSLSEFGWLLFMAPPPQYKSTMVLLPSMASKEVQLRWTGAHGAPLLQQSLLFVKSVEAAFLRLKGRSLCNATMLDFGCGWGRLIRLMLWFSHPDKIFGIDAWERSLQVCADHRVPGSFAQCDQVIEDLPFEGLQFDLIYAFSVFTHLSEQAMMAAQSAIRRESSLTGCSPSQSGQWNIGEATPYIPIRGNMGRYWSSTTREALPSFEAGDTLGTIQKAHTEMRA